MASTGTSIHAVLPGTGVGPSLPLGAPFFAVLDGKRLTSEPQVGPDIPIEEKLRLLSSSTLASTFEVEDSIRAELALKPGDWSQAYVVEIANIDGRPVRLTEQLRGVMRQEHGRFFFEVPKLNMFFSVSDLTDATKEFDAELQDLVEEIANSDDVTLDPVALELKQYLKRLLGLP